MEERAKKKPIPNGREKDITGLQFGRLTAIKRNGTSLNSGCLMWECRCVCGKIVTIRKTHLLNGSSKSCGCLHKDIMRRRFETHGLSIKNKKTPRIYRIWRNMKSRCNNKNTPKFKNHGGRGISVCGEWSEYINFHNWAINNGYMDSLVLDRIDNNGNYEPSNCRWVTPCEQNLNKRNNRILSFDGKVMSLTEWASFLGCKVSALSSRLNDYKWSVEKTLSTPIRIRRRGK